MLFIFPELVSHIMQMFLEKKNKPSIILLLLFLLKSYDCFCGQAEVSISVTLGYHSKEPHIAKLYRKISLVFNYYCWQKTIFHNSSARIQVETHLSV